MIPYHKERLRTMQILHFWMTCVLVACTADDVHNVMIQNGLRVTVHDESLRQVTSSCQQSIAQIELLNMVRYETCSFIELG